MTLHEKWKQIDHRLKQLDLADQEDEAELLSEAYEQLIFAYQEARELNDEMESLAKKLYQINSLKSGGKSTGEDSLPKIFFSKLTQKT